MSDQTPTIQDRIIALSPRIIRRLSLRHNPEDIDDRYQDAVLGLLERAARDPEFGGQRDAYILQAAIWYAGHARQRAATYVTYVESLEADHAVHDRIMDDEEDLDVYDVLPGSGDPARLVERRESLEQVVRAVKKQSPTNQAIVSSLISGVSESQTAANLGLSRPALSQRKATIRQAIARASPGLML